MEDNRLVNLTDARKMEMAVFNRMHEIFAERHKGQRWLDAPEQNRLAAKTAAETELDTPEKRLAYFLRVVPGASPAQPK